MKMLKLNAVGLLLILAAMFFVSSCGYEKMEYSKEFDFEEELIPEEENLRGRLSTELILTDKNDPMTGAVISISTNNSDIRAQFTAANISVEKVTLADIENSAKEEMVENIEEEAINSDPTLLNSEEHFFTLEILNEFTKEGEFLQYTFSDELLKTLKKYKARTHIQFYEVSNSALNSRGPVDRNAFTAYGDGGSIVTKLHVRYTYNCNNTIYGRDTNGGFLYSYTFRSCHWPWTASSRKRYTGFTLIQDVLKRFTRYNTSWCNKC